MKKTTILIIVFFILLSSLVSGTIQSELNDHTIVYYDWETLDAGNLNDLTNYNNDGTPYVLTLTNGIIGDAYILDGALSNVTSTQDINWTTNMSFNFWVRINITQWGGTHWIFESSINNHFYITANDTIRDWGVDTGDGVGAWDPGCDTNYNLKDDMWHMVTVVVLNESNTLRLYVDGIGVKNCTNSISMPTITEGYVYGARYNGISVLYGTIDETSIFNTDITQEQIIFLYNNGSPASDQQYPFSYSTISSTFNMSDNFPTYNTLFNSLPILFNLSLNATYQTTCNLYINDTLNQTINATESEFYDKNDSINNSGLLYFNFPNTGDPTFTTDSWAGLNASNTPPSTPFFNTSAYHTDGSYEFLSEANNDFMTVYSYDNLRHHNISIVAWLKPFNEFVTTTSVIFSYSTNWYIGLQSLRRIVFYYRDETGAFRGEKSPIDVWVLNEWHQYTWTREWNGTHNIVRYYYDNTYQGNDVHNIPYNSGYGNDSNLSYLASYRGTSGFYNGSIDSIKIYSKVLTKPEIDDMYYNKWINRSVNFTINNITDNNYDYIIECYDNTSIINTTPNLFTVDINSPIITTNFNNLSLYFYENLTAQINFTDNLLLHTYNISIDNTDIYGKTNLSTDFYVYNLTYNITELATGKHNLTMRIADGHTASELRSASSWDKTISYFLRYDFKKPYDPVSISMKLKEPSLLDRWATIQTRDRVKEVFIPRTPRRTQTFVVESNVPIQIVEKDGYYGGKWLIIGDHWKDFVLENEPNINISITRVNDKKVEVEINNIEHTAQLNFHSTGDLNIVENVYDFYVINMSTYNVTTDYDLFTTYFNLTVLFGNLTHDISGLTPTAILEWNNTNYTTTNLLFNRTQALFNISINLSNLPFQYFEPHKWYFNLSNNSEFIAGHELIENSETNNLTFYAVDQLTGASISDFQILLTSLNYSSWVGQNTTSVLYDATFFVPNGTFTAEIIKSGYSSTGAIVNISVYEDENYTFELYPPNSFNVSFYNETTRQMIIGLNISADIIFNETNATSNITDTGFWFIQNLTPGNYEIRYSSDYHEERSYIFILREEEYLGIKLYLVDNDPSVDITNTLYDEYGNTLTGYTIKLLRYYPEEDGYLIVDTGRTNDEGQTVLRGILNGPYYKFRFLDENENIIKTGTATQLYSTDISHYLTLGTGIGETLQRLNDVSYEPLIFLNDTNRFKFEWDFAGDTDLPVRVDVYKVEPTGETLYNSSTVISNSGTLYVGVEPTNDTTYKAIAKITFTGSTTPTTIDILTKSFTSIIGVFGSYGLFITALIIICLGMTGLWNPVVAVILVPIGLLITRIAGLHPLSYTYIISIIAVAGIIAVIINKKT